MPRKFNTIKLTTDLEKCEKCQRIIKRGEPALLSRDVFVCDEFCLSDWREVNEPNKDERFLRSLGRVN